MIIKTSIAGTDNALADAILIAPDVTLEMRRAIMLSVAYKCLDYAHTLSRDRAPLRDKSGRALLALQRALRESLIDLNKLSESLEMSCEVADAQSNMFEGVAACVAQVLEDALIDYDKLGI